MDQQQKLVVWKFLDGRPGHENQVSGLAASLGRLITCDEYAIRSSKFARASRVWLPGVKDTLDGLPRPHLLMGAGHATHLPMLSCRSRFGGRTVVVMKPSLPSGLFDLCLIPSHDRHWSWSRGIVRFEGALNRVRPAPCPDQRRGLLLIGGPSRHFHWTPEHLLSQITSILGRSADISWKLITSERTPPEFAVGCLNRWPHLPVITPDQTSPDWLLTEMSGCGTLWVTSDSVSMIYEAITLGARVGLLELSALRTSRVAKNVDRLLQQRRAVSWTQWMSGKQLPHSAGDFCEADRCAAEVVRRCVDSQRQRATAASGQYSGGSSMNLNPLM